MDKRLLAKLLGEYIHERRTSQRLTQAELALKLGFTAQFLGRIENGVVLPSKEALKKIINELALDSHRLTKIFRSSMISYIDELYESEG